MKKRIELSILSVCVMIVLYCTQSLASDDFRQLNNEGFKHLRNGEYDRAIRYFDEALRLNPDYGLAHGNRGIAYFILGRFADALNDFQVLQRVLPDSDAALKVYLAEARMGKADPTLLTDLEAHTYPAVYHRIVVIDYYLGKTTRDAALEDLEHPKNVPTAWFGQNRKARLCYAYFYFAERALIEGNRSEGMQLLRQSVDTGVKELPEYVWAKGELETLQSRPGMLADTPVSPPMPTNGAVPPRAPKPETPVKDEASGMGADATAASVKNVARYDAGFVEGHTYKNLTVGLELTVPEELTLGPPKVNTFAGTEQFAITISADSKPHNRFSPRNYIVDEEVRLNVDPLAAHSLDERSLDSYMRLASQAVIRTGFKPIDGPSTTTVGGVQFSRANFARGRRLHTVLVAIHRDYAISFLIISDDAETAERLIKSTVLKSTQ
jgi:lipoprotein NlpI